MLLGSWPCFSWFCENRFAMKPMLISRAGMMISKKPALPGCVRPCVPEIVFTSDGTLGNVKLVICNWTCLFLWKYPWGAQHFKMLRGVGCRMRWIRSWWRFLLSLAHRIWLILRHCFGCECWWWSRCAVDTCKRFHGSTSKLILLPIYESLESYGYRVSWVHHPWVVATPHNRSGCAHQFGQKSGAWIGSGLWLGWQSLVPFLNCW